MSPNNGGNCISVCNMWERTLRHWKWAYLDMVSCSCLKQALFFTHRSWHPCLAVCHLARDQLPKSALATSSACAQEAVVNSPFLRQYTGLSELIFLWQFYWTRLYYWQGPFSIPHPTQITYHSVWHKKEQDTYLLNVLSDYHKTILGLWIGQQNLEPMAVSLSQGHTLRGLLLLKRPP